MPLYEYKCQKCASVFEVIQKISDSPLIECPECGGRLKKVLTAPAIQFKGSGFYITDYAKKKKPAKEAKPKKSQKSDKKEEAKGKTNSDKRPSEKT
ncbi:MAG: zinc ribbon domain-containing protein [Candidatus Aminicenantes bacterium]|jgi:putative FmdB family regulatory protein